MSSVTRGVRPRQSRCAAADPAREKNIAFLHARAAGLDEPRGGAVALIQRFGGALNLNVHIHALVLDGVCARDGAGLVAFHPAQRLTTLDVAEACDTGLDPRVETCGCLLRGPFGICLIPRICTICRNDVRHRPATVQRYAWSWIEWALTNQREQLAIDEPLNWVMHLGTHNSFNSYSEGHQPRIIDFGTQIIDAPNQFYSMTDQLNLGARMLAPAPPGGHPDRQHRELLLGIGPVAFGELSVDDMKHVARTASPRHSKRRTNRRNGPSVG